VKDYSDIRLLVTRPVGPGGVAAFYDAIEPYLGSGTEMVIIHNPDAKNLLAKVVSFPRILMRFIVKAIRVDVVCCNPSLVWDAVFRDMVFMSVSQLMGKRTVVFFHGWDEKVENRIAENPILRWLFLKTYGRAEGILVLGSIFERKLRKLGIQTPCHRITTVASGQGCSSAEIRAKAEETAHTIRCLFISRLVAGKGMDEAIEIYLAIKERFPEKKVSLTIAGDGAELKRLEKLIEERAIPDVSLPGFLGGEAKERVYRSHHILLLPSRAEGLPSVVPEAMLYGLVLAMSPVGGVPDLVTDQKNGILLSLDDLSASTERLCAVIESTDSVCDIAMSNHNLALNSLTPEQVAKQFLTINLSAL